MNKELSRTEVMRQELKKYSWKTLREFARVFPCPNDKGLVEVYPREYYEDPGSYSVEYIEIESNEDFWRRWNRFKKLKAFL